MKIEFIAGCMYLDAEDDMPITFWSREPVPYGESYPHQTIETLVRTARKRRVRLHLGIFRLASDKSMYWFSTQDDQWPIRKLVA